MIKRINHECRTRNWVETNDESRAYNDDDGNNCNKHKNINRVKVRTSMIRSSLSDYSDTYILVKGTITVP